VLLCVLVGFCSFCHCVCVCLLLCLVTNLDADSIGFTDIAAPELFVRCHRCHVLTMHSILNFLYGRVKSGHPVLHEHKIQNGTIVFQAHRISNGKDKKRFNKEYVCEAKSHYRQTVDVIELVGLARIEPGTTPETARPFDLTKKECVCAQCGVDRCVDGKPLLKCGRCSLVYYCSSKCQRTGWLNGHERLCKRMSHCDACQDSTCSSHGRKREPTVTSSAQPPPDSCDK
jgi:hypothetical protein